MKDRIIMFSFGCLLFVLGLLLNRRESKLFDDPVGTSARVVGFDESLSIDRLTMYTMRVVYTLSDGTTIQAREQSSANNRKHELGAELDIQYSRGKPDLFVVRGDKSRKHAIIGITVAGLVMMAVFGYMILSGWQPQD